MNIVQTWEVREPLLVGSPCRHPVANAELPSLGGTTIDLSVRGDTHLEEVIAQAVGGAVAAVTGQPTDSLMEASEADVPGTTADQDKESPAGAPKSFDDYDPREAAKREIEKIKEDIVLKRQESSSLRVELDRAVAELDAVRTELQAVRVENNIAQTRQEGREKLDEANALLKSMVAALDKELIYTMTLEHMVERMRKEKIVHTKNLKLLEEAIRVQAVEQKLQDKVLRQAQSALDTEQANIKTLLDQQRRMKKELDTKLEARQQEVAISQARKAEREKRLHEEETLLAQVEGDLTAKQEEELRKRMAKMKGEAKLAAQRLRFATIKADTAEEAYNQVRLSAGATESSDGADEAETALAKSIAKDPKTLQYRPPNPMQVVHRFKYMAEELTEADRQIADLARRVTHLSRAKEDLKSMLQPSSMDAFEETDVALTTRLELKDRADEGMRRYESQRAEHERLEKLRVFLSQSVEAIHIRLQHITPDIVVTRAKPVSSSSTWAQNMGHILDSAMERLVFTREEIDQSQQLAGASTPDSLSDKSHNQSKSKQFEATVESVVSANEMGIRIPTRAKTKAMKREMLARDFRSAAQQFTSTHTRAQRDAATEATMSATESEVVGSPIRSSPRPLSGSMRDPTMKKRTFKQTEVTKYLAAAVAQTGQAVNDDMLDGEGSSDDEELDRAQIKAQVQLDIADRRAMGDLP
jgi:hypothetical protein